MNDDADGDVLDALCDGTTSTAYAVLSAIDDLSGAIQPGYYHRDNWKANR